MKKCLLALACSLLFACLAAADTVVYDFYAPWCAPCKQFEPVFDAWKKRWESDRVKFVKVNIDENKTMVQQFRIRQIPTVIVVRNGREIARFLGAPDAEKIRSLLE